MKRIILSVLVILALALPFAVLAQDSTEPAPTAATIETSTPVETETAVPVPTQVPAPPPVNTSEFFGSIFTLLAIVTTVFVGGTLSIVAILEFLRRKDVRDTSERLFLSTPPETQKMIRDLVLAADEARKTAENVIDHLFDFVKSISDGQPNADSAAAIQSLRDDLNATNAQVAANKADIQAASR